MEKQINSRLEFLQDTINYYWNKPERRCFIPMGSCKYHPVNDLTEGCAIGRHLSTELQIALDKEEMPGVSYMGTFKKLPSWMQKLGQGFLSNIQDLHDAGLFNDGIKDYVINTMKPFLSASELEQLTFPQ